ncbi:radical SAM protein [Treponema sp. C6A8]|uniref:radical SAM protein n=1 Tax=Treponema sp. C6A8 TaxID=1410609 RepID=UPI00047F5BBD|nr:radical SAM protein [Treponema sp. C6A8]
MADLPLDRPAGILVKTTCVDFPGHLAGSFFLKGCNLRCPYCYNRDLVLGFEDAEEASTSLASTEELFTHLERRQGILTGLTISGGEPLLNPYTPLIIKKARELGYLIKLDTNGTLPDELEAIINNSDLRPDFIAMDIKTSPERYGIEICNKSSPFFGKTEYWEKKVRRCAEIVSSFPAEKREFRTVLVPSLVQKEDIKKMAEILPQDASWQFAPFRNENCLNPAYNDILPYSDAEAAELVEYARTFVEGAELR